MIHRYKKRSPQFHKRRMGNQQYLSSSVLGKASNYGHCTIWAFYGTKFSSLLTQNSLFTVASRLLAHLGKGHRVQAYEASSIYKWSLFLTCLASKE
ncbi:hypothetical protein XELAEV_18039411mg [Xenopus laevis]|uniref:Uncharacterized protein n=1 Tax=Xenopus laevis TaxID=8355 RepID=A0A974C8V3_XENLA|nr:hypothetical protein XELAEV_18039411mg [Xenopus laevis]